MKVIVKPELSNGGFYKMAILIDGENVGYVHWIETGYTPHRICKCSEIEFAKALSTDLETAQSMCDQVQALIDSGNIE